MKKLLVSLALLLTVSGTANAASFFGCLKTSPVHFDGSITEAAVATPDLSTLVFALQSAELDGVLNDPGDYTVYAPVNSAFAAIPGEILNAVLADTSVLSTVLLYHVSSGDKDPRRAWFPRKVSTLAGQDVFFNRDSREPNISNSVVQCTPVKTNNGTVYIIDKVLFPQF